ncbi:MAG: hypothetical protein AB1724_02805 [Thermodesulfobacteriota bacterium]
MEWVSALFGFAMGLLATLVGVRLQRSWQEHDDNQFCQNILKSLIVEIQNGLERTKSLTSLRDQSKISFGRIYIALWGSVSQRLAGSLKDGEVLNLLHQIYYRFDLINFNFEKNRPEASGAFAATYVEEIENNLNLLKNRIGLKDTAILTTGSADAKRIVAN